ncbi:IS3 family transposase [Candidatus Tisiphia endosymbiont of Ditula angustiorana]|uniref:IS3 family transposase n=1 Tax=Candidatus Tisiphia endosymbiont of Ditula angustiorana TaxID=3066272 RepID=UPI00312CA591
MNKNKLRVFSTEEKSKIVIEVLREENPISVLASKHGVSTKTIKNWKKQFLANAPLAFEPAKAVSEYQEQINKLKEQNDELAKALGKTTVERDWAVGKLNSLDLLNKKNLVDSKLNKLSKARRCELLNINRSSVYYQAKPMSSDGLKILHRIDEIYTDNPEYGYRYIHRQLLEDGLVIGKDRVLKYMNLIGIEAIYPKKKKLTSIKDDQHKVHNYLLGKYWTNLDGNRTVKTYAMRKKMVNYVEYNLQMPRG